METAIVISMLAGLVIGLAIGAFAALTHLRSKQLTSEAHQATAAAEAREAAERARADSADARAETQQVRAELAEIRRNESDAQTRIAEANADRAEAMSEAARFQAELRGAQAERDHALNRVKSLQEDAIKMADQFKLLSTEALERQGKTADAVAEERLKATRDALEPVAKQLETLQARITEVEKERTQMATELRNQVSSVIRTSESLRHETNALSTALRKPQVRGNWGELQLKRAVQVAGMLEHVDFLEQDTAVSSTDATIRPDLKVFFGEDKFVYVDSKVPMSAFLDALETEDDRVRNESMNAFGKNVRSHVDQLSSKSYWKANPGSPEFVIMFIPSEALAAQAMDVVPDLIYYAAERNVVIATPNSLIGMLRTVAYSWKQAALAESAAEVFGLARELYDRLGTMGDHFQKLGRSLGGSIDAYNSTVASLESRVFPTARKLRDLQVADKELDAATPIEKGPKVLTAPELQDALELGRPEPTTEQLVLEAQPKSIQDIRRRLSS